MLILQYAYHDIKQKNSMNKQYKIILHAKLRCHPPASNSISPSSPLYLSSISLGNLVLISSQSALLTNVSDLVAVRSQEPTRTLQRGQLRLLCSKVPFKHRKQRLCVQGSVTGSINIPRHTGHIKSLKFTSAEDRNNEISNNFDVLEILTPSAISSRIMDTSVMATRKRSKILNSINRNSNSLQDDEENIKIQKESKADLSIIKDKQVKYKKSLNVQFSKGNAHSERPKRNNTSNRFTMVKNPMLKKNKVIMYDDTVSDIDNKSYELFNDTLIDLNINNEQKSINDISMSETITPKSSPISITLTPQRTTKTPKKSPLHLTSPKTHSEVPLRISKTPRKLMLSVNSMTKVNNSEISLQNRKSMNNSTLNNISMSNIKIRLNKLNTNYTSTENVSRLSKSPKMLLRSPNTKSKLLKMKSNKKGKKFTITTVKKSPSKDISTKIFTKSKKDNIKKKSLSNETSDLELTLTNVNNLSALYREIISKKSIVILERIPLLDNLSLLLKSQNNPMNSTFDVKCVQKQLFKDSDSLKNSILLNIFSKNNEVLNNRYSLNLTSTPQINLKSHLNDNILLHLSPKATSSPVIDNKMHENSICLDSINKINKSYNNSINNTINVNNKETKADETYELLEPKTPYLQQQCRKRRAVETNINDKRDTKRVCKVRFAASESHNRSQTIVLETKNTELNTSISLSKTKHASNITVRKTPIIRHISHMRSSSVSNGLANKTTSDSELKKRSISMSNLNRTLYNNSRKMDKTISSTLNKIKHIENQEKKDIKIHSAKKIPNFSEIHKKLFSKMESVVDNKNRLIKQHEALKTFNVSRLDTKDIKKPISAEIKRDGYTKFGFKIRKADATNIILRKQQTNRQKEKREENRILLKGVRTNRRFELQMKMRMFKRKLKVHICELPRVSGSNLPKLPPNANIFAHWKRRYQKLLLVSVKHPLTHFFLRSRAAITFEKRRHGRSLYWWIIHPYSILRFFWDLLMMITFLYFFIILSYIIGFYRIAKNADPEILKIIDPAYIMCIIDIILNFITGYVSVDNHKIFLDPNLIGWHYTLFPLFLILGFINNILPILKIIRLGTLHQYFKQLSITFGCSHIERMIIWLIIQTLLIFHWSSCFSYVFPYIIMHMIGDSMENSGTYVIQTELYKQSDWIIYIESLHIGLMIMLKLIESLAEPELKYNQIIHEVKNYIQEKKLPKHLQDKLLTYYKYRFRGNFFTERAISNTLSNHLNQEIMTYSNRSLLETAKILHNLSPVLLGHLISILKPVIYMETDVIYKCHDEGDCMYFIASGTVALITFWGKEICHLETGDHFGAEVLLNSQKERTESVLALELCELLRFDHRDFKRLVLHGSELFTRIENDTIKRHKLIEELEKLHEESEKQKNELKK
ncbi:putative myosin light chain kinase [Vespula squamosa]|uniref:Myosin light chain kinase n=1 Tax=Vespula squamosa TaxID=30214 RepID=A0ABD2BN43_VESSQ